MTNLTTADICAAIAATGIAAPKRPNNKDAAIKALKSCMDAITGSADNGAKAAAAILSCGSRAQAESAAASIKAQAEAPVPAKSARRKAALALIENETPATDANKPAKAPRPAKAEKAQSKRAAAIAAAKDGVIPEAPDMSAPTHKAWVKRLESIKAMVEAHDLVGLKSDTTEPRSSSRAMICRYRDLAIIAIEARQAKAAA